MADDPDKVADAQLAADDVLLTWVAMHIANHIDVYPFVLQLLNTVLRSGATAPSCGGSEPRALNDIHSVVRSYVEVDDPMSVHFFDKELGESPR